MTANTKPTVLGSPIREHTLNTMGQRRKYMFKKILELGQARRDGTLFPKELRYIARFLDHRVSRAVPEERQKRYISHHIPLDMFPSRQLPIAATNLCVNINFFDVRELEEIEEKILLYLQRAHGRKKQIARRRRKTKEKYLRARRSYAPWAV